MIIRGTVAPPGDGFDDFVGDGGAAEIRKITITFAFNTTSTDKLKFLQNRLKIFSNAVQSSK